MPDHTNYRRNSISKCYHDRGYVSDADYDSMESNQRGGHRDHNKMTNDKGFPVTEEKRKPNLITSRVQVFRVYPSASGSICNATVESLKGVQGSIESRFSKDKCSDDEDRVAVSQNSSLLGLSDGSASELRKISSNEFAKKSARYVKNTSTHSEDPSSSERESPVPYDTRNNKSETVEDKPSYTPPKLIQNSSTLTDFLVPTIDKYEFPESDNDGASEGTGRSINTINQDTSESRDRSNNAIEQETHNRQKFQSIVPNVSEMTGTATYASTYISGNPTYTYDEYTVDESASYFRSKFSRTFSGTFLTKESALSEGETISSNHMPLKQNFAWVCILLSASQFGILSTQILLCGFASININPLFGPFPYAFSEWGGKNTYLLLEENQYYRFITPIFLHVGLVHLLVNAFFQLYTCAYFELEWGCFIWVVIYLLSGFGSCLVASIIDPNEIGVCSSGAIMGLFGAKLAQIFTWSVFDLKQPYVEHGTNMVFDQLGGVVWSAAAVFLLTFLTYIDWSGHLGGLATGFFAGMVLFSYAILNCCSRFIWSSIGMLSLAAGAAASLYILFTQTEADEELANACTYFRNLYPEDFICECSWDLVY